MLLSFILVYATVAAFYTLTNDDFKFEQYNDNEMALPVLLVIELIVASILSAIWLHQSFWMDILLPIALSTIVILAYMRLLSLEKGTWKKLNVFVRRIGTNHAAQAMFLAAICFCLSVFDIRSITSFVFLDGRPLQITSSSTVYAVNSYIVLLSLVWMIISFSRFNFMLCFKERKARKQYPLIRREGYEIRPCGYCGDNYMLISIGYCKVCNGTGRVEIKAPSAKCSRCSGMGLIKERKHLSGSAFDNGVDDCPDCIGKGWITSMK